MNSARMFQVEIRSAVAELAFNLAGVSRLLMLIAVIGTSVISISNLNGIDLTSRLQ